MQNFHSFSLIHHCLWQSTRSHLNVPTNDHITFDSSLIQQIWIPDLWFMHSTGERKHNVVRDNQLLRVAPDGKIFLWMGSNKVKVNLYTLIWADKAQRFTLEMDCHMDFHLFPFDYQLCPVELESYGHTTADIVFKWIGERSILYAGSGSKKGFILEGSRYLFIKIRIQNFD